MELAGKNGDKFELTVIRYQFPHSSTDEWDPNWLIVRTHATIADHEWTSDDPALLTWEVEELANWLESLGNNHEVNPLLDFVELNLDCRSFSNWSRGPLGSHGPGRERVPKARCLTALRTSYLHGPRI